MANCIRCGRQMPGFSFGKKICQWCVRHEAYERGELADDEPQPVMAAPWVRREGSVGVTQIIFGINVAVFLGMAIANGNPFQDFPWQETMLWGANSGRFTLSGEWWRLLTSVFVHGGFIHIAFNMWCLWYLGMLAESLYGRWTYLAIYLTCGVGASLASVAWHFLGSSVGASGAIFGLAGALIASFSLGEFSMPKAALRSTLRSLVIFAAFNLFFGRFFAGTDNGAHIGGLVTGLIVGGLIALVAPEREQGLRRVAVFLLMALALTGWATAMAHHYGLPLRLGRASFLDNRRGRVIAQLEDIVKQRPDFLPGHFSLAQAYFNRGQLAQAEGELKRVLELDPQHAGARALLGMVYLNQNRPQEAKDTFTQLLAQNANNAEAHYDLGLALADQENHQAAIEEYKTAIRLEPKTRGVNYNLGVSYAKLKMYDDAIAAFLKEREQSGDNYEIEAGLAEAYQAKGMTQQAQEAKRKAEQLED